MSRGLLESLLRVIGWAYELNDIVERYQRHHPKPLAPGMVTWPTRRRRRRRP